MSTRLNIGTAVPGVSVANDGVIPARLKVSQGICLADSRVHEVEGHAALGQALAAASVAHGLVFWIGGARDVLGLRARGFAPYLDVARLVTVQTADRREALWAGEEALRCSGAGLVVIQVGLGPNLFESRRLQVAAQTGGSLGLVMVGQRAQASAAASRWHCEPGGQGVSATDSPSWRWQMTKNRRGELREWSVRCERPPGACLPPDLLPKPSSTSPISTIHDPVPVFATYTAAPRRVVSAAPA